MSGHFDQPIVASQDAVATVLPSGATRDIYDLCRMCRDLVPFTRLQRP